MRVAPSSERNSITVNYDGLMDNRIRTVVLTAGTLGSRRHINLPGVHVNLPALTEKDLADVALGVELGVDSVALSFARKKEDLEELRQVLQKSGSTAQVVAKIESQSAVREIGIRMALGAQTKHIGAQFLSLGLRLLGAGVFLGAMGAWVAGRAMQSVLFGVPTLHIAALFVTALVMGVVSLVACLIPARRATKVDPMIALRAE